VEITDSDFSAGAVTPGAPGFRLAAAGCALAAIPTIRSRQILTVLSRHMSRGQGPLERLGTRCASKEHSTSEARTCAEP
jgi:hypothetical protein